MYCYNIQYIIIACIYIQVKVDLRHENLLKKIIEGDVDGHVGRGRLRREYMTHIMKDNKGKYKDLKELCHVRESQKPVTNESTDL